MRKNVFGRQFKRDANERKALFKSLASSLVLAERITTTEAKAKAIRPYVEKLVTKAKKNGANALQYVQPYLVNNAAVKMAQEIAPRFAKRPGGYTRITHAGNRISDNAAMVVMEWVEKGNENLKIKNEKLQAKREKIKAKPKREVKLKVTPKSRISKKEKKA